MKRNNFELIGNIVKVTVLPSKGEHPGKILRIAIWNAKSNQNRETDFVDIYVSQYTKGLTESLAIGSSINVTGQITTYKSDVKGINVSMVGLSAFKINEVFTKTPDIDRESEKINEETKENLAKIEKK